MQSEGYDDRWPTCAETYASFRLFGVDLHPEEATELIGVEPTHTHRTGDPVGRRGDLRKTGAWIVSSQGRVDSQDLKRHVDWLLDLVEPKIHDIRGLTRGATADLFCYWRSKHGHGGPNLTPRQMARLAELELTIDLDVYFTGADEDADE